MQFASKLLPESCTKISLHFCVMEKDVWERNIPNVETFEQVIISFVIKRDSHLFNLKFKPKCGHAEDSTIEWHKVSKPNSRLHPNCKIWNAALIRKSRMHWPKKKCEPIYFSLPHIWNWMLVAGRQSSFFLRHRKSKYIFVRPVSVFETYL